MSTNTNPTRTMYAVYVSAEQAYVQAIHASQGEARATADRLVAEHIAEDAFDDLGEDQSVDEALQLVQVGSLDLQMALAGEFFGWYAPFDYLVCDTIVEAGFAAMVVAYQVEA